VVSFRPVYVETSAVAKLVLAEPESDALAHWLTRWPDRVTSALTALELTRVLRRARARPAVFARARTVLDSLVTLRLDDMVLAQAGALKDPQLRSLDALHLGAALSMGDFPEAFVTYDDRLAQAARRLKLAVASPA
jgi:uncharacterized protein